MYWEKLKTLFSLAAYGMDPEFWDDKPWRHPGVSAAIVEQFQKRRNKKG